MASKAILTIVTVCIVFVLSLQVGDAKSNGRHRGRPHSKRPHPVGGPRPNRRHQGQSRSRGPHRLDSKGSVYSQGSDDEHSICQNVYCGVGGRCVGGTCVPRPPQLWTCANVKCSSGFVCRGGKCAYQPVVIRHDVTGDVAGDDDSEDVLCKNVQCKEGTKCVYGHCVPFEKFQFESLNSLLHNIFHVLQKVNGGDQPSTVESKPSGTCSGEVCAVGQYCRNGLCVSLVKQGHCPASRPGKLGSCSDNCSRDVDCSGEQRCCFNGCARECKTCA